MRALVLVVLVLFVLCWLSVQVATGGWRRLYVRTSWRSICRSVGAAVRRDRAATHKPGPGENVDQLKAIEHIPTLLGLFGRPIGPMSARVGARWRIWAAQGQTADELAKISIRLASATWCRRCVMDVRSPRSAVLTLLWRDPFAVARPWHAPVPGRLRPAFDVQSRPIDLPVLDDWAASWLIGASAGSGKSGWVNAIVADLVRMDHVHLLGIDLKGGVELAPWQPAFVRVATNPTDADALLDWARTFIDRRTEALRRSGIRHVPAMPSGQWPFAVLVVDELAVWLSSGTKDQVDARRAKFSDVCMLARAAGLILVCALQRPTTDAIPAAARDNLPRRVLLRVATLDQAQAVLGWRPDQATIDQLNTPGLALLDIPAREPFLARSTFGEIDDVTALAQLYARKDLVHVA